MMAGFTNRHARRLCIILASLTFLSACAAVDERNKAEALALRVHEQIRLADFAGIYQESETRFKTVGTEAEFVTFMRGVQEQLGALKHAEAIAYEVKVDSRIGKMHQLYFDLEYDHGHAKENLIIVRSGTGKMELWALEIEPVTDR